MTVTQLKRKVFRCDQETGMRRQDGDMETESIRGSAIVAESIASEGGVGGSEGHTFGLNWLSQWAGRAVGCEQVRGVGTSQCVTWFVGKCEDLEIN